MFLGSQMVSTAHGMIWPSWLNLQGAGWTFLNSHRIEIMKDHFFEMKRVYPKSQNVGYIYIYVYTYPNVGYWWIWWKSNAATLFSHRPTSLVDLGATAMGPEVGAGTRLRIPSANRRSLQNWKLAPWPHLTSLDPVWTIDLNQTMPYVSHMTPFFVTCHHRFCGIQWEWWQLENGVGEKSPQDSPEHWARASRGPASAPPSSDLGDSTKTKPSIFSISVC